MRDEFDRRGVVLVTISTDHPDEIRADRDRHGLQATMLSDPRLIVTDAFGYRNTGPNSAPPNDDSPALPVPTTLLVDRSGTVLWMDQTDNYQRRNGPEVVLAAMREYFD
ncbi:MAG: redoxin domain-containing protein [Pseudomonadales bacterium]|nr:redoxin domain-containing protein [Pseudomonadales bacterium]